MNKKYEHIDKNLIIQELKENQSKTIPEFQEYFNQKYSTNEPYSVFYNIIKTENLWNYITKTKQHESLDNLVQNEELRDILFSYKDFNIKVTDLSKIIEEETGVKYTKYTLKRLIAYYNLNYIVERNRDIKKPNKLTIFQKIKIIKYCNKYNIDFNNLTVKNLLDLYKKFQYNYIEYILFKTLNKNNDQ